MFKYRRHRIKSSESDEEKEKHKTENSQKACTDESNKTSSSSPKRCYYRRFYRRSKPKEEEVKVDIINNNGNDKQPSESEPKIQTIDNNNNDFDIHNHTHFTINSKKDEILKKLSEIVPIIEDKEGEENNTPNKSIIKNDIDNKSLTKNIFQKNIEKEGEIKFENEKKFGKTASEGFGKYKKYYDNELIEAILDVEKFNVNNYLSKDLAKIYDDISKDNLFFKNNIFLGNVDNFEKKTGNLDKRKKNINLNFKEDIQFKLKQVPKTSEIINKFTEKTKSF